jgi:hypothetical protein
MEVCHEAGASELQGKGAEPTGGSRKKLEGKLLKLL